ncbi:MAG: PPC domain-containing protein, partial [Gemmatimonadetes bacterium]|nr:PPC domain-containing protein [Gemmatimonadota bacterium]
VGTPDTGTIDDIELGNVDFTWVSGSSQTATIAKECCGYATVTAVNRGLVEIYAKAGQFENGEPGAQTLRVADALEIDSVRPTVVRYGEKPVIYGVGVDQILFGSIGVVPLLFDSLSFTGDSGGYGQVSAWVVPPDTGAQVQRAAPALVVGAGFIRTDAAQTTIQPVDVFEPDTAVPAAIDVNGPGGPRRLVGLPALYYNPGLYYEPVAPGHFTDWYRFDRQDTTQAVTVILESSVQFDTAFSYLSDSLGYCGPGCYFIGDSAWIISPGFYTCNNQFFFPDENRPQSTIIALRSLPGPRRGAQLLSFYQVDGQHSLVVLRGYHTVNSRIGPDRFEENDLWCNYAEANFSDPALRIILDAATPLFADSTLTIDNPHDVDWYKFRVATGDTITIQTKSRPLTPVDLSDIDLYLYSSTFSFLSVVQTAGSSVERIKRFLPAGDYFLGVVDRTGVPTRYSLCIRKSATGLGCVPPGAAVAAVTQSAFSVQGIPKDPTVPPPGRLAPQLRFPSARP